MTLYNRFTLGLKRNWKSLFYLFPAPFGVIYGIVEASSYYSDDAKCWLNDYRLWILIGSLVISLIHTLYNICEPLKINIKIGKTGTSVAVLFGDIFSQNTHIAIPVNEFFDTRIGGSSGQIGDIVASNSVHGQFITKIYNSDSTRLNNEITTSLNGINCIQDINRIIGNKKKYPIGTTAIITHGNKKNFLFALTHTDTQTNKASADVPTMWHSLEELWNTVRNQSNQETVSLPLVGGALSNVGLEPENLLRLIILSIINSSTTPKITNEINIILHDSLVDKVVLRKIQQEFI